MGGPGGRLGALDDGRPLLLLPLRRAEAGLSHSLLLLQGGDDLPGGGGEVSGPGGDLHQPGVDRCAAAAGRSSVRVGAGPEARGEGPAGFRTPLGQDLQNKDTRSPPGSPAGPGLCLVTSESASRSDWVLFLFFSALWTLLLSRFLL